MSKFLAVVGCILYVISPIDVVPDFFPIVGQADDLAVIIATIKYVMKSPEENA